MRDDPTVVALVQAAQSGDRSAWDQIVERYAPLVWGICQRFGLRRLDIDDVGQSVWLLLFEHLASLREPAALPGWLARTTRNECLRVVKLDSSREHAERRLDPESTVDGGYGYVDDAIESAQRGTALREAFTQLRPRCQDLLARLFREARPPYVQIGAELGMKVGSIGPTRERCLEELRRCPALAALIEAKRREEDGGDLHAQRVVGR